MIYINGKHTPELYTMNHGYIEISTEVQVTSSTIERRHMWNV